MRNETINETVLNVLKRLRRTGIALPETGEFLEHELIRENFSELSTPRQDVELLTILMMFPRLMTHTTMVVKQMMGIAFEVGLEFGRQQGGNEEIKRVMDEMLKGMEGL